MLCAGCPPPNVHPVTVRPLTMPIQSTVRVVPNGGAPTSTQVPDRLSDSTAGAPAANQSHKRRELRFPPPFAHFAGPAAFPASPL